VHLYTSLERAKQELTGGGPVPVTPLPGSSLAIIDPDFTPGLGALEQHPSLGLRCPVRGCGKWYHRLSVHLSKSHADIGGADAVRRALDYPSTAKFVSRVSIEQSRKHMERLASEGKMLRGDKRGSLASARKSSEKTNRRRKAASRTMAERNLANMCEAQIKGRIWSMYDRIRRSPSSYEAEVMEGKGFVNGVVRFYGTWEHALLKVGLGPVPRGRQGKTGTARAAALEAIWAWYSAHGNLPTERDARTRKRLPFIPSPYTLCRAMGVGTYREAMEQAANVLGIHGGRYGLPERNAA
jgi:hypothetical protein